MNFNENEYEYNQNAGITEEEYDITSKLIIKYGGGGDGDNDNYNLKNNNVVKFWKQDFFKDKVGILIFFSIGMLNVIAVGLLMPMLFSHYVAVKNPSFTQAQIESEAARLKSVSDSLPYISNFLLSPLFGGLSDRYGRKLMLFIVQFLLLVDMAIIGLAYWKTFIIPVYISHTLTGVSNCALSLGFSYLADITTKENRAPWFMGIGVALGLSLIIGPLFMMELVKHSFEYGVYGGLAFIFLSIVALIPLVDSIKYADGKLRDPEEKSSKKSSINPFKAVYSLFKSSKYIVCYAILYISFAYSVQDVATTSYYYTQLKFGWGPTQNSILTCLMGGSLTLWSGLIIPFILKHISERRLVAFCFFVNAVFHVLYAFAFNQYMWTGAVMTGSFSLVIINLIQSIISKATPPHIQGLVLVGVSSVSSLSSAAGAFACQNIFSYFISGKAPVYFPGMHFLINAFILFITFIFSVIIVKVFPNPDKQPKLVDVTSDLEKPILSNSDEEDEDDQQVYKVGNIN